MEKKKKDSHTIHTHNAASCYYLYLKDYFQLIGKGQYANEVKAYIDKLIEEKKIESVQFFEWQLYEIMKRKS